VRRTVQKTAAAQKSTVAKANAKVVDAMKDIVLAQMGLYGEIYDELNARLVNARTETPKQWRRLVRRGERVQHDLEKAQDQMRQNLEKTRADLQKQFDKVQRDLRSQLEKIKPN
jgi:FtsZ-binding cell division protein ZapB